MKAKLTLFCIIIACMSATGTAKEKKENTVSPSKRKDIIRLIEVTGASMMAFQIVDQIKAMYHEKGATIPESFWETVLADDDIVRLVNLLVPIYDRHLSHDDIKELIRFYSSPIGKRMLKATPLIIRDSLQVGDRWGMEIHKKIEKKLKEKGFK